MFSCKGYFRHFFGFLRLLIDFQFLFQFLDQSFLFLFKSIAFIDKVVFLVICFLEKFLKNFVLAWTRIIRFLKTFIKSFMKTPKTHFPFFNIITLVFFQKTRLKIKPRIFLRVLFLFLESWNFTFKKLEFIFFGEFIFGLFEYTL